MNKITLIVLAVIGIMQSISVEAHTGIHADVGFVYGIAHQFTEVGHFTIFAVTAIGLIIFSAVMLVQFRKYKSEK
jgi:hypothetical protein